MKVLFRPQTFFETHFLLYICFKQLDMPTFKDIASHLESFAPLHLQESYDNSGWIVGHPNTDVAGILSTLDCTEEIVEEAIKNGQNLIIAHHPIVFKGLKSLTGKNYIERTVIKAIQHNIGIYAIHTNLDNIQTGVNKKICDKLGLINTQILSPKNDTTDIGAGMLGDLPQPLNKEEILSYLKEKMALNCIRHTALLEKKYTKIAVCGGAGSFLLKDAIKANADIFFIADFKYHEFFDAEKQLTICDVGHYESEVFTKDLICEILREKFPNIAVGLSKTNTNPISYY